MRPRQIALAFWASIIPLCSGITISSQQMGGLALARVLFNNSPDVFFSSSGYSGDSSAIRSFTDGPFGMQKGVIISTGSLTSPLAPGDTCPSSYTTDLYDAYTQTYCGADSYNGASYLLNVLPTRATTLLVDIVIASCDTRSADKVLVMVNGVNYAKDENGIPLDSSSKYLTEPWGIPAPNGDTAFAMSSPPLRFSIPLPKAYVELRIAICDRLDGYGDTAVMIKARPCVDCDQQFKVDYDTTSIVSTTTYETTSTITQQASGTARGTISYVTYVTASATSTASSSLLDSTSATFSASSESAPSTSPDVTFTTTSSVSTSLILSTLSTTRSATTSEDTTSADATAASSETTSFISTDTTSAFESATTLCSTLESTSFPVSLSSFLSSTVLSLHTTFLTSEPVSSIAQSETSSELELSSTLEASLESTSTETLSSSTLLPGSRCRPRRYQ